MLDDLAEELHEIHLFTGPTGLVVEYDSEEWKDWKSDVVIEQWPIPILRLPTEGRDSITTTPLTWDRESFSAAFSLYCEQGRLSPMVPVFVVNFRASDAASSPANG